VELTPERQLPEGRDLGSYTAIAASACCSTTGATARSSRWSRRNPSYGTQAQGIYRRNFNQIDPNLI
jgi:hypothetical protein